VGAVPLTWRERQQGRAFGLALSLFI